MAPLPIGSSSFCGGCAFVLCFTLFLRLLVYPNDTSVDSLPVVGDVCSALSACFARASLSATCSFIVLKSLSIVPLVAFLDADAGGFFCLLVIRFDFDPDVLLVSVDAMDWFSSSISSLSCSCSLESAVKSRAVGLRVSCSVWSAFLPFEVRGVGAPFGGLLLGGVVTVPGGCLIVAVALAVLLPEVVWAVAVAVASAGLVVGVFCLVRKMSNLSMSAVIVVARFPI